MVSQTIPNPANAWASGASWDTENLVQQEVIEVLNTSGAIRTAGDLVVLDVTTIADFGQQATTTTTTNDHMVLGVVAPKAQGSLATSNDTYAAGAVMPVIIRGPARINIGANAVAADDVLTSAATAGEAETNALAIAATAAGTNAVVGTMIGIAAEASAAKDANNTIRAYIAKF